MLFLSFTSYPYWIRFWLGTSRSSFKFVPENIIVLGAGNIPRGIKYVKALLYGRNVKKDQARKNNNFTT